MPDFNDAPPQHDDAHSQAVSERYTDEELSRALAEAADRWVPRLFPAGRESDDGKEWRIADITGGRPGKQGSCKVNLDGDKPGWWFDFESQRGGGPLSTIKEALRLPAGAVYDEALRILKECGGDSYLRSPGPRRTAQKRDRSTEIAAAADVWSQRIPVAGTLAQAYLKARGIVFLDASGNLGFNGNTTNWSTKTGEPALIARFRNLDYAETGGIHRIYLKPDGSGHAGKKMLGSAGFIFLSAPAEATGVVGVGEGIESTMSAMQLYGVPQGIAACSDGGMRKVADQLRENGVPSWLKKLMVWTDRGQAGEGAGGYLLATARGLGLPAVLCLPKGDDDFNDDLLNGRAPDAVVWEQAALPPPVAEPEQQEILPPVSTASLDEVITKIDKMLPEAEQCALINRAIELLCEPGIDVLYETRSLQRIAACNSVYKISVLKTALRNERKKRGTSIRSNPVATPNLDEIFGRYVFVKQVNAFWDRVARTVIKIEAVANNHWSEMPLDDDNIPIDPRDVLLKGVLGKTVDKVDAMDFLPGGEEIFIENGQSKINIWTPTDIVPEPGDIKPFLDHVATILDQDQVAINWVLDYCAHLVQFPADKIKSTMLIIGNEGSGKSTIGTVMQRLLGDRNTTTIENSDLASPHNEWMDGVQLVVINELRTIDRQQTMNRLKSYITDNELRINRKNVPTYKYKNRVNFMMFSNYEDAARLENGDRRYFIWISGAPPRSDIYFMQINQWLDRCGYSYILDFLLNRSLDNFNRHAAPPITEAKRRVIKNSRSSVELYLQELFDARESPFSHDLISAAHVEEYLRDRKKYQTAHKVIAMFLRKINAVDLGQIRNGNIRVRLWAIRNAELWQKLEPQRLASAFREAVVEPMSDTEKRIALGINFDHQLE